VTLSKYQSATFMAGNVYSPEHGGRRFIPNICTYVPHYTVPSP